MDASRCVDAFASFPGHAGEQADAEQAYVQADIDNTNAVTYVRLPKKYWPEAWDGKFTDPVVILEKALYGHPDAGGLWERKAEAHLQSEGFVPIENWRSVYYHRQLNLLLMVYVDDFKMAGPKENIPIGWAKIKKG